MADKINPIRATDDDARALARSLIDHARFGALAVCDPETGAPYVSRVGVGTAASGGPVILISSLSRHTQGLLRDPRCSLLVGEPGKGEALTHPRITLMCVAERIDREGKAHDDIARPYLSKQPKAQLYLGLADFNFFRLRIEKAYLNGGFGKAFVLTQDDLAAPASQ